MTYMNHIYDHDNTLHWRHNDHGGVSNYQPHDCLLNRLFRRRSKKTSKLRVTGLCAGNSPGTGEFPTQMASNAENVSIWWCHHDLKHIYQPTLNKVNQHGSCFIWMYHFCSRGRDFLWTWLTVGLWREHPDVLQSLFKWHVNYCLLPRMKDTIKYTDLHWSAGVNASSGAMDEAKHEHPSVQHARRVDLFPGIKH